MRTQIAALFAATLPFALTACGDSPSGGATSGCTSAPVTTAQQPLTCMGTNLVATTANNYAFTSTMKLPPQTVKSKSNLTFDWSGVKKDFLGHAIGGNNSLDTMTLLIFGIPLAEVEHRLNIDTLSQQDVFQIPPPSWPAPGMTAGSTTSAPLYSFTANGLEITQQEFTDRTDPALLDQSIFTYVAAAAHGTTIGEGFRMLQTFHVSDSASGTTVALTDSSTQLTCQVSLRNLTITGATAGTPALTLSWTDIVAQGAKNALGNPFADNYITSAIVGHFTETPEDLEKKFLDLDMIATKYYRADITENGKLDFTTLVADGGGSFPGIDDNGTWMVGLICGNCRNPAPWYMTILKPCTQ